MYFIPIQSVGKGPYLIEDWMNEKYYQGEVTIQPYYTTITNVYEYKSGFEKIPNQIQLPSFSLTFYKRIPTIVPKLYQRMLNQILQTIIGDNTFTYEIFEPELLYYSWHENKLKNNLFFIKHTK